MTGYDMYEEVMDAVQGLSRQSKINLAVNCLSDVNEYFQSEGWSRTEGRTRCMMIFAMIACNDGRLGDAEHELFRQVFGDGISYNEFFEIMSEYNKQSYRNTTGDWFQYGTDAEFMRNYIYACSAIACIDGSIHTREENLIRSLCNIYVERFE